MLTGRKLIAVRRFDPATQRWTTTDEQRAEVTLEELTVATYNIWFSDLHARERYAAIVDVLGRNRPDVMVFQEVTPSALEVFLAAPWIREEYAAAAAVGAEYANYGLLILSRLPLAHVDYTRLPTRLTRGYLRAELELNGRRLTVCGVHLDSSKAAAPLRARQLRRIFGALGDVDDAIVLGDFNMRDGENDRIDPSYVDVWPAVRPGEPGFTEDTSINLMRYDMKDKHRHVRFDRVLVKGEAWRPEDVSLLGTEPVTPDLPRVFPSDHFGVECRLSAADATTAPRVEPPLLNRRVHALRLALVVGVLLTMFYVLGVARLVDLDAVRAAVASTGPAAPIAYVVVSSLLGAIFVPGPLLAAGSGALFGPVLGTFVTLGATVGSALITTALGRRAGRQSTRALLGPNRADRIDALLERGGLWAVVGQRFVPGISDALASYAFGAFGVPLWQMAVGAFIGSVPRAFVYTALGASINDLNSPLAYVAVVVWCVSAVVGAFAARQGYRTWRRSR